MKLFTAILFLFSAATLHAQHVKCTTSEFTVGGAVKQSQTITAAALDSFKMVDIPGLEITNHKGEKKSAIKSMKGILLKDILKDIEYTVEPKLLSELYFVFTACDGYKVVYSWNELFNTATGNAVYIVTEKETEKGSSLKEAILMITVSDFATGRRYIKGLQSIKVYRAN